MRKRILSVLLTLVMLLSLVPAMGTTAAAADGTGSKSIGPSDGSEEVTITIKGVQAGALAGNVQYKVKYSDGTTGADPQGTFLPESGKTPWSVRATGRYLMKDSKYNDKFCAGMTYALTIAEDSLRNKPDEKKVRLVFEGSGITKVEGNGSWVMAGVSNDRNCYTVYVTISGTAASHTLHVDPSINHVYRMKDDGSSYEEITLSADRKLSYPEGTKLKFAVDQDYSVDVDGTLKFLKGFVGKSADGTASSPDSKLLGGNLRVVSRETSREIVVQMGDRNASISAEFAKNEGLSKLKVIYLDILPAIENGRQVTVVTPTSPEKRSNPTNPADRFATYTITGKSIGDLNAAENSAYLYKKSTNPNTKTNGKYDLSFDLKLNGNYYCSNRSTELFINGQWVPQKYFSEATGSPVYWSIENKKIETLGSTGWEIHITMNDFASQYYPVGRGYGLGLDAPMDFKKADDGNYRYTAFDGNNSKDVRAYGSFEAASGQSCTVTFPVAVPEGIREWNAEHSDEEQIGFTFRKGATGGVFVKEDGGSYSPVFATYAVTTDSDGNVTATATFTPENGKQYRVMGSVAATWQGKIVATTPADNSFIYVKGVERKIDVVTLSGDALTEGDTSGPTLTKAGSDTGYTVATAIDWNITGSIAAGKEYYTTLTLTAEDGYVFPTDWTQLRSIISVKLGDKTITNLGLGLVDGGKTLSLTVYATADHNHGWGDWEKDADGHYRKCSTCNTVSDKEAHDWGNWRNSDDDTQKRTCGTCGYEETRAMPERPISFLKINIIRPVAGAAPSASDLTIRDAYKEQVEIVPDSVGWYDESDSPVTGNFEKGKSYTIKAQFTPKGERTFADTITTAGLFFALNETKTLSADKKTVDYSCTFKAYESVTVDTALPTLTVGEEMPLPTVADGHAYTVFVMYNAGSLASLSYDSTENKWKSGSADATEEELKVKADTMYYYSCTIKKGENEEITVNLTGTGNSTNPTVSGNGVSANYDTSSMNKITSVDLTVTAPKYGETPATNATVPTGANYSAGTPEWSPAVTDDKFGTGEYTVSIPVTAASNYSFAAGCTYTVNGYKAAYADGKVSYTFPALTAPHTHTYGAWITVDSNTHKRTCNDCGAEQTASHNWVLDHVENATFDAPGKTVYKCNDNCGVVNREEIIAKLVKINVENLTIAKPGKDVAAAEATTTDTTYNVANTEWMAADGTSLAIGNKFQPGTVYTVKVTLEAVGDGVFSASSTYNNIDGKTATVSPALTDDHYTDTVDLTYTFEATEGASAAEYNITVVNGTATNDAGTPVAKAEEGVTITLTAGAAPDGKEFDKWVVTGATVADANSATTTFTMPASDVNATASYKDIGHTHTFDQEIVKDEALKTSAGCTTDAVYFKSCSCGAISTDDADIFTATGTALGHDWPAADSWSRNEDYHWYECNRCHEKKEEADHDFGEDNICDTCGYDKSVLHTHNLTLITETPATCTTPGNQAYYTCDGCDKWFENAEGTSEIADKTSVVIPALGHEWTAATCTTSRICKRDGCGATVGSPLGHDWADATCTAPKTCKRDGCGATEGSALGHTENTEWYSDADHHWHICAVDGCGAMIDSSKATHTASDWNIDTAATATTGGTKHKECTVCHRVLETSTIPATGSKSSHSHSSRSKSAPEEPQSTSSTASACAAGHTASEWIVDEKATAATTGSRHKECTVCKLVLETDTIPATGSSEHRHTHSYSVDWKSDAVNHWKECSCGDKDAVAAHSFTWVVDKEATADEKGSRHEECKVCGYQRPAEDIPATGLTENNQNIDAPDDVSPTSNSSNVLLWIILLVLSGLGVAGAIVYVKRKNIKQP